MFSFFNKKKKNKDNKTEIHSVMKNGSSSNLNELVAEILQKAKSNNSEDIDIRVEVIKSDKDPRKMTNQDVRDLFDKAKADPIKSKNLLAAKAKPSQLLGLLSELLSGNMGNSPEDFMKALDKVGIPREDFLNDPVVSAMIDKHGFPKASAFNRNRLGFDPDDKIINYDSMQSDESIIQTSDRLLYSAVAIFQKEANPSLGIESEDNFFGFFMTKRDNGNVYLHAVALTHVPTSEKDSSRRLAVENNRNIIGNRFMTVKVFNDNQFDEITRGIMYIDYIQSVIRRLETRSKTKTRFGELYKVRSSVYLNQSSQAKAIKILKDYSDRKHKKSGKLGASTEKAGVLKDEEAFDDLSETVELISLVGDRDQYNAGSMFSLDVAGQQDRSHSSHLENLVDHLADVGEEEIDELVEVPNSKILKEKGVDYKTTPVKPVELTEAEAKKQVEKLINTLTKKDLRDLISRVGEENIIAQYGKRQAGKLIRHVAQ